VNLIIMNKYPLISKNKIRRLSKIYFQKKINDEAMDSILIKLKIYIDEILRFLKKVIWKKNLKRIHETELYNYQIKNNSKLLFYSKSIVIFLKENLSTQITGELIIYFNHLISDKLFEILAMGKIVSDNNERKLILKKDIILI